MVPWIQLPAPFLELLIYVRREMAPIYLVTHNVMQIPLVYHSTGADQETGPRVR